MIMIIIIIIIVIIIIIIIIIITGTDRYRQWPVAWWHPVITWIDVDLGKI